MSKNNQIKNNQINSIQKKIINYFNGKYPTTFPTIGVSNTDLKSIISNLIKKNNNKHPDSLKQNVNNLISILERKVKEKIYSENRINKTVNTNKITLDPNVDMPYAKYINSNFNPIGNNSKIIRNNNQNNNLNNNQNNNKNNNQNNNKNNNQNNKNNNRNNNQNNILNNNQNNNNENIDKIYLNKYDKTNDFNEVYESNIKNLVNQKLVDSGESSTFNNYHLQKANINNTLTQKDIDLLYTEERFFDYNIILDSKDRDRTKFTNPAEFAIDFGKNSADGGNSCIIDTVYGNIESIELLHITILDTTSIVGTTYNTASLPYVILEIPELGDNYNGTNNSLKSAFAILTKYETMGGFHYYEKIGNNSDSQVIKKFNPRINLNKLTVKIKLPDGNLFNFGTDANDSAETVVSIALRITTVQKNMGTNFINKAIN